MKQTIYFSLNKHKPHTEQQSWWMLISPTKYGSHLKRWESFRSSMLPNQGMWLLKIPFPRQLFFFFLPKEKNGQERLSARSKHARRVGSQPSCICPSETLCTEISAISWSVETKWKEQEGKSPTQAGRVLKCKANHGKAKSQKLLFVTS